MNGSGGKLSFAPFFKAIAGRQDVRAVLSVVAGYLKTGAAFREAYTGNVSVVSSSEIFRESAKTFPMLELSRIYCSREVQVGNVHSGVLIFDIPSDRAHDLSDEEAIYIENAVIATALCLERSFSRTVPGNEKRDELLKELLAGEVRDYREAEESFAQWGWKKDQEFLVLVLRLADDVKEDEGAAARERHISFSLARSKVLSFFPKSFCVFYTKMPVFLLPLHSGKPEALSGVKDVLESILLSLKEELPQKKGRSFLFAAGAVKKGVNAVYRSYDEAVRALSVSESLGGDGGVILWDMLGGYQLVAILSETEEARVFCLRILGELLEGTDASSVELLETLLVMERCNWNVRAASESLRFHYNTVKYRLGVLRERIGFDSSDPVQRFDMGLALRLAPLFYKDKFVTICQKPFI